MTDEEFIAATEKVKQFRPVLEKYKDNDQKLNEAIENFEILASETEEYALYLTQNNYEKPRFSLLSRSVFGLGVGFNAYLCGFNLNFSVDNAAGKQLDIIGEIVGMSRLLDYLPPTGSRELSDDEYRLALKLTIAKNTWDGTLGSIGKIYADTLGEDATIAIIDNQDMSIDVNVYSGVSSREANIMENAGLLLCPVGVTKNFNFIGGRADTILYAGIGISSIECVTHAVAEWE